MKRLPYVVGPHQFGRGLFASRGIAAGETVLKFKGRLISFSQSCNPRFERYCVQIGPDCYTLTWAPERYINHSCDPNLGFNDHRCLRALRDIPAGAELTFDYSTSMAENSWTMVCACQTVRCRKLITDFVDLPQAVKDRYRAMGIIPSWLTPEFEADQLLARAEILRRRLSRQADGGNGNGNGNGNGHHE
ncbi:MAG: SET domain-containing protein [Candidatus Zixiibacteriota bacterium]